MAIFDVVTFELLLLFGCSLAHASPILNCGLTDGQMSPAERINQFLDCLRGQGHDEDLLTELKKSFENRSITTRSVPNCTPERASDEKGRFPYCSGMSDLQCRTLILVLDSLMNVPAASSKSTGSSSIEKALNAMKGPLQARDSSEDENGVQGALLNVILSRFSEILDEYKRWRNGEGAVRQRRSEDFTIQKSPPEDNQSNNTTDNNKPSSPDHPPMRFRRQAPPPMPKFPDKLTPEMQSLLEGYLAWREKNGYGKMSGRWG